MRTLGMAGGRVDGYTRRGEACWAAVSARHSCGAKYVMLCYERVNLRPYIATLPLEPSDRDRLLTAKRKPVLRSGSRYIARLLGRHRTQDAARFHGQRRSRQTLHQNSGILAFHAPSVGLLSKHVTQDIEGLAECAHI